MTREHEQMRLGAFLFDYGHHYAAWRHPESTTNGAINLEFYLKSAQAAEQGKFDMVFLADSGSIPSISDLETDVSFLYPESVTLLGALAGVTQRIGLAGTASTTFNEPYNLARRFATLDHLSSGRAGWNVVTSTKESEARNFNADQLLEHGRRYERASEFLEVVNGLWDCWRDDAVVVERESGRYANPEHIHRLNHNGTHFRVEGPLNLPRSPQGRPVIIEAGTSPTGQKLAARTADVVFTACDNKEEAIAFYRQLKGQLPQYGRQADELKVMPGLMAFIGATEEEARKKEQLFNGLIQPAVGARYLSKLLNYDLSGHPIDGPLPDIPVEGNTSRAVMIIERARQSGMTIRELGLHYAVARGHLTVTGTAEHVVNVMEDWFTSRACDGFNIMQPLLPQGLEEFVREVVPLLQARGCFRTEYTGSTLREHLGLLRPAGRR
ncbi:LLM class flavin-dependent oxidoreductase [Paenibacillus sp. HW567]|uniref:LLM class flavin-dependent oxidoreductase n=1 Tax=Paenibacillus sp. HW567 TaxID=1034769 RepID=UPI000382BF14|nr:LLM class flavin-dependent oxidoreductase [Paenibacillus sp. HW567]